MVNTVRKLDSTFTWVSSNELAESKNGTLNIPRSAPDSGDLSET